MTSTRFPPSPQGYTRWQEWAQDLISYQGGAARIKQPNEPRPVLLAHQLGVTSGNTGVERATVGGILMYDPVIKKAVISIDGAWVPLATDAAVIETLEYDDIVLQDAWTVMTLTVPDPIIADGTYYVNLLSTVTGTGGNAEYQFRIISQGTPIFTGNIYSVANGETAQVSIPFYVPYTGELLLEARGNNASLIQTELRAHRIGQ